MEYYFKEVSSENISDIKYLIKEIYGRDDNLDRLHKKYDTTMFGEYTIGYIAYCNKNSLPAAYYGVFPVNFYYDDKIILAAQSGDTMTHPNHRRKGLFVKLANKTYDLAREKKVKFVFGFPVEASYRGFVKKLNWEHYNNIKKYTFYIPTLPYSVIEKISVKFYFKIVNVIIDKFKSSKEYPFSNRTTDNPVVDRSPELYSYKRKTENYNILFFGLRIWFKVKNKSLLIGDLEYDNKLTIQKVIQRLKFFAGMLGLVRICFYLSENSLLNQKLEKYYVSKEGLAIGFLNFNADIPLGKMSFTYADFDTF